VITPVVNLVDDLPLMILRHWQSWCFTTALHKLGLYKIVSIKKQHEHSVYIRFNEKSATAVNRLRPGYKPL